MSKKKNTPKRTTKVPKPTANAAPTSVDQVSNNGTQSTQADGAGADKQTASSTKTRADKPTSQPTDSTAPKVTGLRQFQKGHDPRRNYAGRPRGSRNKLCASFIDDLYAVWTEMRDEGDTGGMAVLRALVRSKPEELVKAIGKLVPTEFDVGDKTSVGILSLVDAIRLGKIKQNTGEDHDG